MENYFNMSEFIRYLNDECDENIISENKVREKFAEMFELMGVNPLYLQAERKPTGEYRFPEESRGYLYFLYKFFVQSEGKSLRKGNLDKVSAGNLKRIIDGMYLMLKKCELSEDELDEQIQLVAQRLNYMHRQVEEEIEEVLNSIHLDFFPENEDDLYIRNKDGRMVFNRNSRFRYRKGVLRKRDIYLFYSMVRDDLKALQEKHRLIYQYMGDIRGDEISDDSVRICEEMDEDTDRELTAAIQEEMYLTKCLFENDEYRKLSEQRDALLNSDEFLKKKKKELAEIDRRMEKIHKEYVDKLFDGQEPDTDSYYDNLDNSTEKDPKDVLKEALEYYNENMR
jgi:hypothetical protein